MCLIPLEYLGWFSQSCNLLLRDITVTGKGKHMGWPPPYIPSCSTNSPFLLVLNLISHEKLQLYIVLDACMREQFASMYFAFSTFRPHEERMCFILLMEREEIGQIVKAVTVILYISINLCIRIIFFPEKPMT